MSKKFTNTDPYRADVDSMWAMLCDQDYWRQKYESMGATAVEFQQFDATDTALTVRSTRNVPADLPGFAKKIIGDTNHVTQTERYTRSGDTVHCQIGPGLGPVDAGKGGALGVKAERGDNASKKVGRGKVAFSPDAPARNLYTQSVQIGGCLV